ncbi:Twitching mobility protein [bacterium HR15]|nr:Twitching mobility protein [bacterium HR15]
MDGFDWRKLVGLEPEDGASESTSAADVELSVAGEELPIDDVTLDDLLRQCVERGGSDLHITVGLPPTIRLNGQLTPLPYKPLTASDTRRLVYEVLSDRQLEQFERHHELDFAYSVHGVARFRFNVYMQRGSVGAAMRVIPSKIPSIESLRLPPIIYELSKKHSGLILVTGPTGSGKSTTLACIIDLINQTRPCHIMTIEDPIEYLHAHKRAMVNQREVHSDTESFHNALRAVLREDPDVILIGEMRDLETIQAALTLAETGHLVLATLHTRNAPQTIDRIIDVFPPHQQEQIRVLLANTIEAIFAQQLIPMLGGGRVAAIEVMIANAAIRNLIREGKTHQIYSIMETSANQGMITMDRALADLHRNGYISFEEAINRAMDKENFTHLLKMAG